MKRRGVQLAEAYIRHLSRDAAARKHFLVRMVAEEERQAMLRADNLLLAERRQEGFKPPEDLHRDVSQRTLQNFFLPIFNAAGSCVLCGCGPEELADSWPGFTIAPHQLGWEISGEGKQSTAFPFWTLSPLTPMGWGFVAGVDYATARPVLEGVLSHTYNPVVVSNPRTSPLYRRLATKTGLRGGRVWVIFDINVMRLEVIASPEHSAKLCEAALRRCHIVAPYQGLLWDETTVVERDDKAKPPRKYRYSNGRTPPLSALEIYPNWMPALDEEGIPGQDETTIRPDDEQNFIGPFTVYTLAEAELADGRKLPALLGQPDATFLHKDQVDLIVVYDGNRRWRVDTYDHDLSWLPAEEGATRKHGDTKIFPMRVRSRLPRESADGPHIVRILHPDGRMEIG